MIVRTLLGLVFAAFVFGISVPASSSEPRSVYYMMGSCTAVILANGTSAKGSDYQVPEYPGADECAIGMNKLYRVMEDCLPRNFGEFEMIVKFVRDAAGEPEHHRDSWNKFYSDRLQSIYPCWK